MRVIAGIRKGIQLKTPEGLETRPTADRVKEAMFSVIQFDIPGAIVLDLFGGTGQLGIEALSRGASRAVFTDVSEKACRLIRENLKRTDFLSVASVVCGEATSYLQKCRESFNIVFLDPPYAENYLENALKIIWEIDILQSGGIIVTERPVGKELFLEHPAYERSRDYKYGQTLVTLYRKKEMDGSL